MSDLPIFSARGKTDSERLSELIAYLPSLSSAIDRQLMSLDFNNLNENLRSRIENSVTEHQDLTGYASKNYAKKNFPSFGYVDGVKEELEYYLSGLISYIEGLEEIINPMAETISIMQTRIDELEEAVGNRYTKSEIDDDIIGDLGTTGIWNPKRVTVKEYVDSKL